MSEKIYGIDLGTTFSCIAGFDEDGKLKVFQNEDGNTFTPSVVWFNGQRQSIVVGAEAKRMAAVRPEAVVSWVKRHMGTDHKFALPGRLSLRAETISSLVLRKLVKDVLSVYNINVKKVVITCPAYFGNNEREATKKAGEMAGLDVVGVINEPTAAAFAYGMDQAEGERTILVYDLGGGTFDVTVMRISKNEIRVIATGGSPHLGGVDWDQKLAELLAERVAEETREDYNDILEDAPFMAELQNEAEAAKIALTELTSHKVAIRRKGVSVTTDVTREEFETVTESLLKRTIGYVDETLSDAGKKIGAEITLDTVLLVGGSSFMPQVLATIKDRFPNVDVEMFKPTEAVARGAAFFGRQMAIREIVREDTGLDIFSKECDSRLQLSGEAEDEILSLSGQSFDASTVIRPINVCSKSYGSLALGGEKGGVMVKSGIKEAVRRAGGFVDAPFRFSIMWNEDGRSICDLDAHAREPDGTDIFFGNHKGVPTLMGGMLDVDMIRPPRTGVENIYWKNLSRLQDGAYEFSIENFDSGPNSGAKAEIVFGSDVFTYRIDHHLTGTVKIATVHVRRGAVSRIEHSRYLVRQPYQRGQEERKLEERVRNIILRNTELPATGTADFKTDFDGQTSVKCATYENDSNERVVDMSMAPRELFSGEMKGLPHGRPKGRPLRDTYVLDENGLLKVTCTDLDSGRVYDYVIQTTTVISDKEIQKEMTQLAKYSII